MAAQMRWVEEIRQRADLLVSLVKRRPHCSYSVLDPGRGARNGTDVHQTEPGRHDVLGSGIMDVAGDALAFIILQRQQPASDLPGVLLSGPQVSDVLVRNHNIGRSGATEAGYRHVERA